MQFLRAPVRRDAAILEVNPRAVVRATVRVRRRRQAVGASHIVHPLPGLAPFHPTLDDLQTLQPLAIHGLPRPSQKAGGRGGGRRQFGPHGRAVAVPQGRQIRPRRQPLRIVPAPEEAQQVAVAAGAEGFAASKGVKNAVPGVLLGPDPRQPAGVSRQLLEAARQGQQQAVFRIGVQITEVSVMGLFIGVAGIGVMRVRAGDQAQLVRVGAHFLLKLQARFQPVAHIVMRRDATRRPPRGIADRRALQGGAGARRVRAYGAQVVFFKIAELIVRPHPEAALGLPFELHDLHQRLMQGPIGGLFLGEPRPVRVEAGETLPLAQVGVVGDGQHIAGGQTFLIQFPPQALHGGDFNHAPGRLRHRVVAEDHIAVPIAPLLAGPLVTDEGGELARAVELIGNLPDGLPAGAGRREAVPPLRAAYRQSLRFFRREYLEQHIAVIPVLQSRILLFVSQIGAQRSLISLCRRILAQQGLAQELRVFRHGGEIQGQRGFVRGPPVKFNLLAAGEAVGVPGRDAVEDD